MPSQTPTPQPGQVHTGIPSLPPNILALLQQSQGQHGQGSAPQQMQSQYGMPPPPPQSMMSPPTKPDNFVPPTANKDRKTPESAPAALSIHPQPTSNAIKLVYREQSISPYSNLVQTIDQVSNMMAMSICFLIPRGMSCVSSITCLESSNHVVFKSTTLPTMSGVTKTPCDRDIIARS
jgi:hypothetical protein